MIQDIIAYILIGVAIGYAIYSAVKSLKKGNDNSCSDCSCCAKKCKKSNYSRDVPITPMKINKV